MAKEKKKETKKETKKEYIIKVPVFTSERINRESGLFPITYQQVIEGAIPLINAHNISTDVVSFDRRNKTIRKIIGNIKCEKRELGNIPYLLLKISAYNTNWEGCLITSQEETVQIENNDKIGSDNNFVMLYPQVIGIENQTIFWVILVYDDPKKDSLDNISTAKLVLTKILNQPVKSVKLPTVLEEIKESGLLPQIKMNLSSIKFDEDNAGAKYEQYCISAKSFKKEEYEYNNMPINQIEELIKSPLDDWSHRMIKLILRKKEYKITQDIKDNAQNAINELVEQFFNHEIKVNEEELNDIYNVEFVVSKLQYVLELYLKNGMD